MIHEIKINGKTAILCGDAFYESFCKEVIKCAEEYNTNTSAQPREGEDIVRPIPNNEGIELRDKELLG